MLEYRFCLAQYRTPRELKYELDNLGIKHGCYEFFTNSIQVIKYGMFENNERVPRQIEVFKGWEKFYNCTAVKQLRRGFYSTNHPIPHKKEVFVTIWDYTNSFCPKERNRKLLNLENDLIKDYENRTHYTPPLNIQNTKEHWEPIFDELCIEE